MRIVHPAEDLRFLPPVPRPPLLRDFMGFETHLRNIYPKLGREIPPEWYKIPVYYKGNPGSLATHGDDISIPSYATALDIEFELAMVVGRGGTNIPPERALAHRADELLDDLEVDVRLEQRGAHLAHRFADVFLGNFPAAGQGAEDGAELVGERVEHGPDSLVVAAASFTRAPRPRGPRPAGVKGSPWFLIAARDDPSRIPDVTGGFLR